MTEVTLNPVTPVTAGAIVSATNPLPVVLTEAVGSTAWTHSQITLDGTSQTLLAANAARTGLIVSNRVGNAQASYSLSGGTVTLINGIPLLGGDRDGYNGTECSVTAITAIGTSTQILDVWEGV